MRNQNPFVETVKIDLYRAAGRNDILKFFRQLFSNGGFRFLFFFRLVQHYKNNFFLSFLIGIFFKRYSVKFQIQIPKSVKIGLGLALPHYGGIVVNSKTIIGDYCTILHNVTIGNTKRGKLKGAPIIGDYVYLGPGAVVVGNITIGNHVLIAPNAYVNLDIPDNSLVIGNPAKIVSRQNASKGYITNIPEY